jgi:hypothetical protein
MMLTMVQLSCYFDTQRSVLSFKREKARQLNNTPRPTSWKHPQDFWATFIVVHSSLKLSGSLNERWCGQGWSVPPATCLAFSSLEDN